MPLRIVKDDEKKPGGFKSTQQKGNIVKGKLKSQKELKKITSSDEYKKADYNEKNKMLNVATHKRGALVGGQKKLDKNNNNRIDAQDFKILKAEKAKGRGQGLQDEKMKPGKPMKAVLGALALGAAGALGAKKLFGKKKTATATPMNKMPVGDLVEQKKKQLTGKKRGGMSKSSQGTTAKSAMGKTFSGYQKVFKTGVGAGEKAKATSTIIGVKPKLPEASKKSKIARRALRAAQATRFGKMLLPVAAAGVAAQQYLKSKMKKNKDGTPKKKMGGGMMQKYAEGGDASKSPIAEQARRMGQRKRKPGPLGRVGRGAAKPQPRRTGLPSLPGKKEDPYMILRTSVPEGPAKRYKTTKDFIITKDQVKGTKIDFSNKSVGGSVTVKTKLGRNKPTKMY